MLGRILHYATLVATQVISLATLVKGPITIKKHECPWDPTKSTKQKKKEEEEEVKEEEKKKKELKMEW